MEGIDICWQGVKQTPIGRPQVHCGAPMLLGDWGRGEWGFIVSVCIQL